MNSFLNSLFVVKCYKNFKPLFFIIIFLIAGILYTHKTKVEFTPFFHFGAYSQKIAVRQDYFFSIQIDNNRNLSFPHTFDEPRRMMIFSTLNDYNKGILNNKTDPARVSGAAIAKKYWLLTPIQKFAFCKADDYNNYLPWLKKYLQLSVNPGIKKVKIFQNYMHFDSSNIPSLDSTILKYQIDQ